MKKHICVAIRTLIIGGLFAFSTTAIADLSRIYLGYDVSEHQWALFTRQIGANVYIVGEKAINFSRCKTIIGAAPATNSFPETNDIGSVELQEACPADMSRQQCIDDLMEESRKELEEISENDGSEVAGICEGEEPNYDPSTFVFKGRRSGSRITGNYWYVPKGVRSGMGSGTATLVYPSHPEWQDGDNLRLDFAELSTTLFVPVSEPRNVAGFRITTETWPIQRRFGYPVIDRQTTILTTRANDLSGIWYGDDGGRYYILQQGNQIVWFGEHPGFYWSNVAIGQRNGSVLELQWVDVAKGETTGNGSLRLKLDNSNRIIVSTQTGGFGGTSMERDPDHRTVTPLDLVQYGELTHYPNPRGGYKLMVPQENPRGDSDFDGNGPEITVSVSLRQANSRVLADVNFEAMEIGGDGTIGRGSWTYTIYSAPPGRRIRNILSPSAELFSLESESSGYRYGDVEVWSRVFAPSSLLSYARGAGDTGGQDISDDNNPDQDTSIHQLLFNPLQVELVPILPLQGLSLTDYVIAIL